MSAPVAIAIVSHQSAADLPACLAAVARLVPPPAEVVVVDCASTDGSPEVAQRAGAGRARVVALTANAGYAGGMNAALALTTSPWVLSLNPDTEPAADFLAALLARAAAGERTGAVAARLVRPGAPARLDACGMVLRRSWRHLDRGAGELDHGQYGRAERVFGATGAASLWSRAALADAALDGEVFDERFHSFREDAELCFRLRERQWEVLYEPAARCLHRRRVTPERRRALPAALNRRSLQNRYLLRAAHQSAGNLWATLPWTLPRDLGALVWVLLLERGSLPAYGWLWRHRRAIWARRRAVRARRTAPPGAVERWFARQAEPL